MYPHTLLQIGDVCAMHAWLSRSVQRLVLNLALLGMGLGEVYYVNVANKRRGVGGGGGAAVALCCL